MSTMNKRDAFKILGLTGEITPATTKLAYRLLCKKYHPDRNPAGLEIMQLVNVAYSIVKDETCLSEATTESATYGEHLADALNAIINHDVHIEICGAWVWVSGNTRDIKEILKEAGFKWAPKKLMWYYRPDDYKSSGRGKHNIEEIRFKYGSVQVKNNQQQRLSA
jgi:hypothetical protein